MLLLMMQAKRTLETSWVWSATSSSPGTHRARREPPPKPAVAVVVDCDAAWVNADADEFCVQRRMWGVPVQPETVQLLAWDQTCGTLGC